jgi:hypothetical protein
MPSGCIEFGEYLDTEVTCSALRTNYAPLIAPLRHVDVDLHLRQIRSPTHSLSKVARHTRHRRVLSVVASVSRFLCVSCMGSLSALRLLPKGKAETARIIGLGTGLDMGMTEAHYNPRERVPVRQKFIVSLRLSGKPDYFDRQINPVSSIERDVWFLIVASVIGLGNVAPACVRFGERQSMLRCEM